MRWFAVVMLVAACLAFSGCMGGNDAAPSQTTLPSVPTTQAAVQTTDSGAGQAQTPSGRGCGSRCPQLMPPPPGFCGGGKLIEGIVDRCGCRGPPRCERGSNPQPERTENLSATFSFLEGKIRIGPLCPVEKNPPEPGCQPTEETYKSHPLSIYLVDEEGTQTKLAEFFGDPTGYYKVPVPAGDYVVRTEKQMGPGSIQPMNVTVSAGKPTTLDIDIDTGIR